MLPGCSYRVKKIVCPDAVPGNCYWEWRSRIGMQMLGSTAATEEDWTACCPRLDAPTLEQYEASAGYADALFCLREAACHKESAYIKLKEECEERCCHNVSSLFVATDCYSLLLMICRLSILTKSHL